MLWILDPAARDATAIRQAYVAADLRALTEIICSRTPSQIQLIKQHYHSQVGIHLEEEIQQQTPDDHQKVNSILLLCSLFVIEVRTFKK